MFAYDGHTHTTWSDGRNSLEENARQAAAGELQLMVATDHYWPERLDVRDYVAAVVAEDARSTIKIVPGLEVTLLDSQGTVPLAESEARLVQWILADLGGGSRGIAVDPPASVDRYLANVFAAYHAAVANPLINVLAHPFNLGRFPANVTPAQIPRSGLRELAAAMYERDVAFEIMNQMPWWFPDLPLEQFNLEYADLLAIFSAANVKFVIGSDTHSCCGVGNDRWCRHIMRMAGIEKSQVLDLPKKFGVTFRRD